MSQSALDPASEPSFHHRFRGNNDRPDSRLARAVHLRDSLTRKIQRKPCSPSSLEMSIQTERNVAVRTVRKADGEVCSRGPKRSRDLYCVILNWHAKACLAVPI